MKKAIFIIAVICLAMSCKKQTATVEETVSKPPEIVLNESTIFLVDGTEPMTYSEYQSQSGLSLENDPPRDTGTCVVIDFNGNNYIFRTPQALRKWSNETSGAQGYALLLDTAEIWQNYATQRGIIDDSLATIQYTDSLIAAQNQIEGNPTPLLSAFYNGYNYAGTPYYLNFIHIRPSFGNFNKMASSLADYYVLPKLNMLAERTWFRGGKFFYTSWRLIPNLSSVGFDNKTSSKL